MRSINCFKPYILYVALSLFFSLNLHTQTKPQNEPTIRIADFRGKSTVATIMASTSATRKGIVVVLVRGGDDKLWEEIHGHLTALVKAGYSRIGLMRGDLEKGERAPVVVVFSDGTIYATIKEVKANAHHGWSIYNLVKDAYKEHVIPKIKNTSTKINKSNKKS